MPKSKKNKPKVRKRPMGGPVSALPMRIPGVTPEVTPGIASSMMEIPQQQQGQIDPNVLQQAMQFLQSSQGQNILGAGASATQALTGKDPTSSSAVFGSTASGAMKGVQMGAVAGPWGAAIGGVLGGAYGLVTGKDKQGQALQAEQDAYLRSIKDKTVVAGTFPFGGIVSDGAIAPGDYVEVQTEDGEMALFPNFEMMLTKSKGKHKDLDKDHVSDKMPKGSFIFSNRTMFDPSSILDDVLAEGVPYIKEGHENHELGKVRMSDVLSDKKQTFAEAAEQIAKKIPVKNDITDVVSTMTDRENKETRMMYITRLMKEHERLRPAPSEEQIAEEAEIEIEEFAFGGAVGFQDPFGRIPGIDNVMQPALNNQSAYVSSGLLSDPKTQDATLGGLERNLPDIFKKITYNNSSSNTLDLSQITPDDLRTMDKYFGDRLNAFRNPGQNMANVPTDKLPIRTPGVTSGNGGPALPFEIDASRAVPPSGSSAGTGPGGAAAPPSGRREFAGPSIDELTDKYKNVFSEYLAENEKNFTNSNAQSDKLTRDLNFANALSSGVGAAALLGQDTTHDVAYAEGAFVNEMFQGAPQSQIEGITNKLTTSRDNIVQDLINSGVSPGDAVTQAAGIIDRTMAQEGDVRTKFAQEQQQLARQRYGFLNKLRDYNAQQDVIKSNTERDNRNKVVSAFADVTQNAINADAEIRKADIDRKRQIMRERFVNKYAGIEGQYGVEMTGIRERFRAEERAASDDQRKAESEALIEDMKLRREAEEKRRIEALNKQSTN